MNRRQLLRLGAMAAVAPKVLVTPVAPVTWVAPAFGNGLIAHLQALQARAIAEAGIAYERYQYAAAGRMTAVALAGWQEQAGLSYRSAPVSVLP